MLSIFMKNNMIDEYKNELINLLNRAKRDLTEEEYAELIQLIEQTTR